MEKVLLRIDEAADLLGIARSHVYRYIQKGELYSIKLGKSRRVPRDAIDRFIERLKADQRDESNLAR